MAGRTKNHLVRTLLVPKARRIQAGRIQALSRIHHALVRAVVVSVSVNVN